MNKALEIMLGLLGVAVEGEDLTQAAVLKAAQERATTAIAALKTKAEKSGKLETDLSTAQASVTALKASAAVGDGNVDPAKFVPVATYNALASEVATLKNGSDENSIEQLLKDNGDKIYTQADRDYLEDLGKSGGVAALKAALSPRVAIAALKQTQTKGKDKPEGDQETDQLSTEQLAVCKNMGISHADFKAQLAKETINEGAA